MKLCCSEVAGQTKRVLDLEEAADAAGVRLAALVAKLATVQVHERSVGAPCVTMCVCELIARKRSGRAIELENGACA